MPELPEVETMRRDLEAAARDATITGIEIRDRKILLGATDAWPKRLVGRRLVTFGRHGKILLLGLNDDTTLLAHPRMTGHWLALGPNDPEPSHTRFILHLDNGRRLAYEDLRRFGRLELAESGLSQARLLRNVGPDALQVEAAALGQWLRRRRQPIKLALLDQRGVAGVGNIYASEILHRIGLDPRTPACALHTAEIKALVAGMRQVLGQSIEYRGTTILSYRTGDGAPGEFRRHLRVYGREGERCRKRGCRGRIQRLVMAGRSTYFCPLCQRRGRRRGCTRRPD